MHFFKYMYNTTWKSLFALYNLHAYCVRAYVAKSFFSQVIAHTYIVYSIVSD